MSKTRREQIAEFLMRRDATVKDVAAQFGLRVSEALDDLEHIRLSHATTFAVEWARCSKCEFVFEKRDKLSTPSRCPECRNERIEGPWFSIAKSA